VRRHVANPVASDIFSNQRRNPVRAAFEMYGWRHGVAGITGKNQR
jgi:hypothetical protein